MKPMMTDAEAIAYSLSGLPPPDDDLDRFVAHCLQALADRKALVEACEDTAAMDCPVCVDAARRHMRGEL